MKITDLAILFIIITIPFNFMMNIKMKNVSYSTYKKIELNRILDTAVEDATSDLVEVGEDKRIIINKEKAVSTFFNSLYLNFDIVGDSVSQRRIDGYIPAIVVVDYDGYHILSNETYTNSEGYKEIKQVWKPKRMYSYSDSKYVYSFTLDDLVTVYDIDNKVFYKGKFADIKSKVRSKVFEDDKTFDQVRRRTIIESIKKDINYYINKHNEIARQFAITYHFTLPVIEDEDWYKTIDDVGILAFFQGLPIGVGNERFNSFAVGGARIVKAPKFLVDTVDSDIKYYHKEGCPYIKLKVENGKEVYLMYNSQKESAKEGYFPCHKCNP